MKRIIHVVAGLTLRGGGLVEQVLGVACAHITCYSWCLEREWRLG